MSKWKKYKLGELGKFSGGVTSIKKEDYGHGFPFLQYTNVYKNSKVDINNLELMNVSKKDLEKRNCLYGDIFFTASSETEDEVAMSSVLLDNVENLTFNGFCKRYRLHNFNTLLPEFARYLFRSKIFRNEVYQRVTGDIRFNISQASLAEIPILLPPLPEQRAIAEVLSSLDDKIDLLHRQNQTLEQIAQTLFRKWFIEDAKEEWEEVSLEDSELSTIISSGIEKFEGEKIYLATGDVQETNVIGGIKITYENRPSRANMQPVKFSVWFAKKGGVRKLLMFDDYSDINKYILSTGFSGLKTNELSHYYIWCFILTKEFQEIKDSFVSGSVQPDITNEGIKQITILRPNNQTLINFNKIMKPLFYKYQQNKLQIQTLEKLRDTLLPKLMSGEVRVRGYKNIPAGVNS